MKLYSPAFEKALRREVREVAYADSALKKEYRRGKRPPTESFRGRVILPVLRLVWSSVLAMAVVGIFRKTHEIGLVLLTINLWTLVMLFNLVNIGVRQVEQPLRLLPISDATIFHWRRDETFQRSFFLLLDLIMGLGALGIVTQASPWQWAVIGAMIPFTWAFLLALGTLGAARLPGVPPAYSIVNFGIFLFVIACISIKWSTSSALLPFVIQLAPWLNSYMPTGWPLSLLQLGLPSGAWWQLLFTIPIGWVFWRFKTSLLLVEARFVYPEEPIFEEPDPEPLPQSKKDETSFDLPVRTRPMGETKIEEGILSGELLARPEWNHGWIENKLWNRLTEREKDLMSFAYPQGLKIAQPWLHLFRQMAAVILLGELACWIHPQFGKITFTLGFLYISGLIAGQIVGQGRSFASLPFGGIRIPLHAALPFSARELTRFWTKCMAIHVPFFLLLSMAAMFALEPLTAMSWESNILGGINLTLLAWGLRYFILGNCINHMTTARGFLRRTGRLLFFGFFVGTYSMAAILGIVSIMAGALTRGAEDVQPILTVFSFSALILAYIYYRLTLWYQDWGRFDLMQAVR